MPLVDDDLDNYSELKDNLLKGALEMQRLLRFTTIFAVAFPAFLITMVLLGKLTWMALVGPVIISPSFTVMVFYRWPVSTRWWWLKRGPILTSANSQTTSESREWLKIKANQGYYDEVVSGCFKFYSRRLARLFYLHWC